MAAVAAKRKRPNGNSSQWGVKLVGLVLCAFFVLGVVTGLSRPGHLFAHRLQALINLWPRFGHSRSVPDDSAPTGSALVVVPANDARVAPVALIQREQSFFALGSDRALRGPVTPEALGDLPIISGSAVQNASASQLVDYARMLARAEAELDQMISQMLVTSDGATFFLERLHTAVVIDPAHAGVDLAHAVQVLRIWHGHENLIAAIDLTVPGQAILQFRPSAFLAASASPAGLSARHPPRREFRREASVR